jgi:hypothetical protein
MRFEAKVGIVALVLTVAVGATAAWAMWSANGSGSGRSTALTAQTVTVNAVSGTADLYPGFNNGDLFFTLTNTNPYPVRFTAMSAGTVTSSDTVNCPSSNVTVDASATGLTVDVAANSTSGTLSVADVVNMALAAPNGCQGKTFTIVVTLTGAQN